MTKDLAEQQGLGVDGESQTAAESIDRFNRQTMKILVPWRWSAKGTSEEEIFKNQLHGYDDHKMWVSISLHPQPSLWMLDVFTKNKNKGATAWTLTHRVWLSYSHSRSNNRHQHGVRGQEGLVSIYHISVILEQMDDWRLESTSEDSVLLPAGRNTAWHWGSIF